MSQHTLGPITTDRTSPDSAAEREKLETRLCRLVGQAIADYRMIEEGDKIMVCLSGGKDSYGLLEILLSLRSRAPIHFDLIAVNLDQKQPGFPAHVLPEYLARRSVPFHIEERDTYSVVKRSSPKGKRPVRSAHACVEDICIGWPPSWGLPNSRWDTIATTSSKHCCSISCLRGR